MPEMKFKEFFKKHLKKIIVIVVIAVVAIAAIIFYLNKKKADELAKLAENTSTEMIERTDVSNVVNMTGTIVANDSQTVYSTANSLKVLSVDVEVGDVVKKGDVVAVLDSTQYESDLETAKRQLAVDEAIRDIEVRQAQETLYETKLDGLDNWYEGQKSIEYANTDYYYKQKDVNQACEDLSQAKSDLQYDKEQLEEKLEKAKDDRKDAKEDLEEAVSNYNSSKTAENESKKNAAESAYEAADDKYDDLKEQLENIEHTLSGDYKSVLNAERSVDSAYESLEKEGRTVEDTAHKFADSAEKARRNNQDAEEALTKQNLKASVATDSQEDKVSELQDKVDDCTIKAPLTGVVTSVSMEEGDETSNEKNTICVIQDTSVYKVEGKVDEYDISKVYVGQKATIKTEATGDEEMTGVVSFVSPTPTSSTSSSSSGSGSSSSSAATYSIKITLDNITDDVRIGMTAETSIILDMSENTLAVPYDCILDKEDGTSVVYVVDSGFEAPSEDSKAEKPEKDSKSDFSKAGGKPSVGSGFNKGREVTVTKGIESDYYVEISGEGISEGMEVYVVGDSSEDDMQASFGGGMGGPGMGGPGPR